MNKRVMETLDKHTQEYMQALLDRDKGKRIDAYHGIMNIDDSDMAVSNFITQMHFALLSMAVETVKYFYTLVHKSDIIIESNGGENE